MDEAYMEFATEPDCCSMVDYMKAHPEKPILVLRTFSKYYAMAGLRVGYALGSEELIGIMRPGLIQLEIGVQSTNPRTIREIHRVMDLGTAEKGGGPHQCRP